MARAGFCAACGANVYLDAYGSCVNGHPASSVSGVYEVPDAVGSAAPSQAATAAAPTADAYAPPAAPTADAYAPPAAPYPAGTPDAAGAPPKKRNTALIVVVSVIAALLLCCIVVVVMIAMGGTALFGAAASNAPRLGCFANERIVEGASQQWLASEEGRALAGLGPTFEDVTSKLLDDGLIVSDPTCASGGSYTWALEPDGVSGKVTCSVHGHFTDEPLP